MEVTDIRVQQLKDLTVEDCLAEGIQSEWVRTNTHQGSDGPIEEHGMRYFNGLDDSEEGHEYAIDAYRQLWESIHGSGSWDENKHVWAVSFKSLSNIAIR